MDFNSRSLRLSKVNQYCGLIIRQLIGVFIIRSPSKFSVQFGTLSSLPNKCQAIAVKTIVMHPDYLHDEYLGVPNDIALLEVRFVILSSYSY